MGKGPSVWERRREGSIEQRKNAVQDERRQKPPVFPTVLQTRLAWERRRATTNTLTHSKRLHTISLSGVIKGRNSVYPGNINRHLWEITHCGWGRNSFILHSITTTSAGDSSLYFVYVLRWSANLILCLTLSAHCVSLSAGCASASYATVLAFFFSALVALEIESKNLNSGVYILPTARAASRLDSWQVSPFLIFWFFGRKGLPDGFYLINCQLLLNIILVGRLILFGI